MDRITLEIPKKKKIIKPKASKKSISRITPELLAYSLPGALAHYASTGRWQYADHLKLIENACLETVSKKRSRFLISVPPRHGKELAHTTPVFTTKGWKKHGDLKIGDYVFGLDGKPTKVVALGKEVYGDIKMTFGDGESIYCHEDHEWNLLKRGGGARYKNYEAKDLLDAQDWPLDKRRGGDRCTFMLPHRPVCEMPEKELSMHPYMLGVWLGDGTAKSGGITKQKDDLRYINRKLKVIGYELKRTNVHKETKVPTVHYEGMFPLLNKMELRNNKHIPIDYITSSVEQRLELLAGLIDTDGHVYSSGRINIVNTNKRIVKGVLDIVRSLGWRCEYQKVPPQTSSSGIIGRKPVYYIAFNPSLSIPTVVPRKKVKQISPLRRRIGLVDVRRVKPRLGRCIQVEAADGLYLAGRKMTPTHNSTLISHYFPVWFLGHNPDKRVLFVSYQAEYAKSWGRRARNTFADLGESIFGLSLSDDMQAANNWGIAGHMGGMETVGAEGALTGKGADLLLIDDPTKGREQALNARLQANQYDWFQSDVYTRLEPGASILIIATRWSTEDLIGRLIENMNNGGEYWDIISLPALAEEGDVLGRAEGAALWPERYSVENLLRIKKSINEYWFAAEYQQRPAPVAGDLIKLDWFRRYGEPPAMEALDSVVLSFDTASKEKEINDYSVVTVWGLYNNCYYLLDVIRDRLSHPRLLTLSKNLIAKWKPNAVLIEDKGSGISLIQHLRLDTSSGIIAIEPIGDKVLRMQNETPAIEAGQVFLPEAGSQPWLADFEDEIRSFPNSARKDQVDSLSQFLKWCREKGGSGIDIF